MDDIACQARLSMGFLRQEYWSDLPFPFPGDLPNPVIEPVSPALQAYSLPLSYQGSINRFKTLFFFRFLPESYSWSVHISVK